MKTLKNNDIEYIIKKVTEKLNNTIGNNSAPPRATTAQPVPAVPPVYSTVKTKRI